MQDVNWKCRVKSIAEKMSAGENVISSATDLRYYTHQKWTAAPWTNVCSNMKIVGTIEVRDIYKWLKNQKHICERILFIQ